MAKFNFDPSAKAIAELISLKGRSAVVTGGARGIGFAISNRLAEAGASLLIADLNLEEAQASAKQIAQKYGANVQAIALDASHAEAHEQAVKQAQQQHGGLDIWVNNAGIYPFMPVLSITDQDWDKLMNLNLRGAFFGSRAAGKAMVASEKGGVIINIVSTAALHTAGNPAHYVASKHGLAGLTKSLAAELGSKGIRAVAIAPTLVDTPGVQELRRSSPEIDKGLGAFADQLPLGRTALPDDIARAVLFAASDLAMFVTGIVLPVDGGETGK